MRKSTSTPRIAMPAFFIALAFSLFAIPSVTSSESQNVTELQTEMAHLQNILAQMDNGTLNRIWNSEANSLFNSM